MIGTLLQVDGNGFFPQFNSHWLIYLALLFSVIAILTALFRSRRSSKSHTGTDGHSFGKIMHELNRKLEQGDLRELRERLTQLEDRMKQTEQPIREVVWDEFDRKIPEAEVEMVPDEGSAQPVQERLFAKLADLDEGFSSGVISTVQNGEQIYEIQTDGETAVYRISDDPNAQKYALSEANYTLGRACEFVNPPFRGCKIVQLKEGSLIKSSGNWIIQEKAKIEFR